MILSFKFISFDLLFHYLKDSEFDYVCNQFSSLLSALCFNIWCFGTISFVMHTLCMFRSIMIILSVLELDIYKLTDKIMTIMIRIIILS